MRRATVLLVLATTAASTLGCSPGTSRRGRSGGSDAGVGGAGETGDAAAASDSAEQDTSIRAGGDDVSDVPEVPDADAQPEPDGSEPRPPADVEEEDDIELVPSDTGDPPELACDPATFICPLPPEGSPDAAIIQLPGVPEPLAGGVPPQGAYEVIAAEIYPDSLGGGEPLALEVEVSSNGNTYGSTIFVGDGWALNANMDLLIKVPMLGQSVSIVQELTGGGCYAIDGAWLTGDLLECAAGLLPEFEFPDLFGWETNGDVLRLHVFFPKEAILATIPEEYVALFGAFLQDDLQVVFVLGAM